MCYLQNFWKNCRYSKTWLQRPPQIATTCFKRPLFRARTVSYRNCTANSDHLPCATSDRVFRAPSACFPWVERPCDDPKPPFMWSSPTKVWRQVKKCSGRKAHFRYFTFWTLLMIFVTFFSFRSPLSFALLQCVAPANRGHLSTKTAFVCTKGWSLCTGFTVWKCLVLECYQYQIGKKKNSTLRTQWLLLQHYLLHHTKCKTKKMSSASNFRKFCKQHQVSNTVILEIFVSD